MLVTLVQAKQNCLQKLSKTVKAALHVVTVQYMLCIT